DPIPGVPACQPNPDYDLTKDVIKKGVIRRLVSNSGKITSNNHKDATRVECDIRNIDDIINMISDRTASLMGFNRGVPGKMGEWDIAISHPRDLIMHHILIPPPILRPHAYEGGTFRNDMLTTSYQHLIKKVVELTTINGKMTASSHRHGPTLCQSGTHILSEQNNDPAVIERSRQLYEILHDILLGSSKIKLGHGPNKMIPVVKRFDGKKGIGR